MKYSLINTYLTSTPYWADPDGQVVGILLELFRDTILEIPNIPRTEILRL